MARLTYSQTSFNAGELSPRLYGQVNFNKYVNGVETAENVVCLPHGPIKRRNGSKYIANAKDSSTNVRLIKFQFDKDDDAFILEFGNQYIRFFRNGGQIYDDLAITNGTFDADISGWTDNSAGTGAIAFNTDHMDLTGGGSGNEARAYQQLKVGVRQYTVTATTSAQLNWRVGTTPGGSDVSSGTINGAAQTFNFTASTAGYVYLEFENPNNDTRELDTVSISSPIYEIDSPYTTAQLFELTTKRIDNTLYIAHGSHATRALTRTDTADWDLEEINFVPPPTYEAGESPPFTLTPSATTGTGVNFTSSTNAFRKADVGREIQNQVGVGKAVITSYTSTSVVVCEITEDFASTDTIASGDWKMDLSPIADLTIEVTDTATALSIVTITSDEPGGTTALATFRGTDVGKYILIHDGIIQITAVASSSSVSGQVLKAPTAVTETANWTLESATWDATRGYPRAVGVYQQRLVLGSTTAQPQTFWMSEPGFPSKMGVGSGDADAIQATLGGEELGRITWIASGRELAFGTIGGEVTYSGSTPATLAQTGSTAYGSDLQNVAVVNNEILFLQQSGKKIRTLRYSFDDDNYIGDDLLFLAEHLAGDTISHFVFAQEPDLRIYAVTTTGEMLVGVYQREQETIGWSKFTTDGDYISVNTIARGGKNEVWVVVQRDINSSTVNYVELFDESDGFAPEDGFSDSYLTRAGKTISAITQAADGQFTVTGHGFSGGEDVIIHNVSGMSELNGQLGTVAVVDSNNITLGIDTSTYGKYTSGGEVFERVTSISGLDHLEGETVSITVDSAVHPSETVSSGSVTLDYKAGQVVIGLPYTATIKTMRPNITTQEGNYQAKRLSNVENILRFYNSATPTVNGNFRPARSGGDAMDTATPLVTGDVEYPISGGWDNKGQLDIVASDPLPMMLLAIFSIMEGNIR